MLTYSLRSNAALRGNSSANSAFARNGSRPSQDAVVLSMERHLSVAHHGDVLHEPSAPALRSRDNMGVADHAIDVFPSSAVTRRAASCNGLRMEVVQTTTRDRTEFGFRAPFHLLIAYEQGIRRDGESFVEGLPASKLREVRRRLTFVPAGHEYREWQEAHTLGRIVYFYFDPAKMPFSSDPNSVATSFAPRLFFEDSMLWESAMKAAALIDNGLVSQHYWEALGTVLAHELVRLNAEARRPNPPVRGGLATWQQRVVTNYIEDHLAETISLAKLSQLVRLSVYHFCRAFKKSLGVPPHRYHTIRRIERAKSLLAKPACSVTEIGLMVGFSETSSFTAAFRRMTGSTPTTYRRSVG
jgi:AraC family transcriptional regulator